MMFDCPTIREIDRKLEDVAGVPEFHMKMRNGRKRWLRGARFLNSFLIEHPECYKGNSPIRGYAKRIRNGVRRLEEAWEHVKSLDSPLVDFLDEKNVLNIAGIVDPQNFHYRNCRVSLGFRRYTPPNPLKVGVHMKEFLCKLKYMEFHPIERAAFAHSRIAAIQPFIDGNKRTARLIQNGILRENNYPYVIIPLDERSLYLDFLEDSMVAYRDGDMKRMGPFFNYIATKVNNNLDYIVADIKKR